jgi:hypothetical protein
MGSSDHWRKNYAKVDLIFQNLGSDCRDRNGGLGRLPVLDLTVAPILGLNCRRIPTLISWRRSNPKCKFGGDTFDYYPGGCK